MTIFKIERHQHAAVDVLKDSVGLSSAIRTCRLMACLGGRVSAADQNASPPICTPRYAAAPL